MYNNTSYKYTAITKCLITASVVLTRIYALVHQVRVYAFGAPTTHLRGWCTPKALTNQGGRTHQYINHVVCFNTRTSHYLYKYTILHVFHARRYDSIVLLSWYKHILLHYVYKIISSKLKGVSEE